MAAYEKILIVEDNDLNLRIAEQVLKSEGYEVIRATSGMECLLLLQKATVDLILLDIQMPVMSGFDTINYLKKDARWYDIPVIFLTASSDTNTVCQAMKLGAVDYIKKPLGREDMLNRIRKALDHKKHPAGGM